MCQRRGRSTGGAQEERRRRRRGPARERRNKSKCRLVEQSECVSLFSVNSTGEPSLGLPTDTLERFGDAKSRVSSSCDCVYSVTRRRAEDWRASDFIQAITETTEGEQSSAVWRANSTAAAARSAGTRQCGNNRIYWGFNCNLRREKKAFRVPSTIYFLQLKCFKEAEHVVQSDGFTHTHTHDATGVRRETCYILTNIYIYLFSLFPVASVMPLWLENFSWT